ncbi:nuclear transport factor 2 family protein [Sulfitobacter sp. F26204]|uniref:nuclear transport factor 2 family protein n=1 Tax=Sulfitobacter sp. F26204 TaxID=2996014 RepID=UPI00225E15EA|nr:nuclear transport factor 2 family protein [Sulfitobacter sp. F26204]MCX7561718.1 nuclear transport factor 2 family protein [Sulfitobacter sp. F26204]
MRLTLKYLAARIERLEAESAIRNCLSDYMDLCDRIDGETDLNRIGALFTEGAVWEGRGSRYAKDFGAHRGRKAILNWMRTFCVTPPHFTMNAHFLSSEKISVLSDTTANGRWLMLQTPKFHDGQNFLMAAQLQIDFAVEDGVWRIARFRTTNLYSRKVEDWDQPTQIPNPVRAIQPTGARHE